MLQQQPGASCSCLFSAAEVTRRRWRLDLRWYATRK